MVSPPGSLWIFLPSLQPSFGMGGLYLSPFAMSFWGTRNVTSILSIGRVKPVLYLYQEHPESQPHWRKEVDPVPSEGKTSHWENEMSISLNTSVIKKELGLRSHKVTKTPWWSQNWLYFPLLFQYLILPVFRGWRETAKEWLNVHDGD